MPPNIVDSSVPRWEMDTTIPPTDTSLPPIDSATDDTTTQLDADNGAADGAPNDVTPSDTAPAQDTSIDVPPPTPPPNDLPSAPTILAAAGGTLDFTLAGATQQASGCGGAEVYFQVAVPENRIVTLDTFGTPTLDTMISYRGADCMAAATCSATQTTDGNDACQTVAAGEVRYLTPGTHCFAVSMASSNEGGRPFRLAWGTVIVPPEANVFGLAAQSSATYTRSLATGGTLAPSCQPTGGVSTTEHFYAIGLCPSARLRFAAHTCGATTADTVISILSSSGVDACNDDSATTCSPTTGSRAQADITNGAGLVGILVDGKTAGNYALRVDITQL